MRTYFINLRQIGEVTYGLEPNNTTTAENILHISQRLCKACHDETMPDDKKHEAIKKIQSLDIYNSHYD